MSGASNLGWANSKLFVGNNTFVNNNSNNNPLHFGSNETSSFNGLEGSKNNIDAAAGKIYGGGCGGSCHIKGGSKKNSSKKNNLKIKKIKQKIKNITKLYKMKGSKKRRSIKHKLRSTRQ